jgi:hypothetical protein
MAELTAPKPKRVRRPLPTATQCEHCIRTLRRYQDLIRHRERWPPDILLADPLETLIPPRPKGVPEHVLIEREIDRLSYRIHWIIEEIGLSGDVLVTVPRRYFDGANTVRSEKEQTFDLIAHYREIPGNNQKNFELLMRLLEEAIGTYEGRKTIAAREVYYPRYWFARIIRFPIDVLEHAGLISEEGQALRIYAAIVKFGIIGVIVLAGLRLGVSVPWKRIL